MPGQAGAFQQFPECLATSVYICNSVEHKAPSLYFRKIHNNNLQGATITAADLQRQYNVCR